MLNNNYYLVNGKFYQNLSNIYALTKPRYLTLKYLISRKVVIYRTKKKHITDMHKKYYYEKV